jgi:hypothetical protein
MEWEPTSSVYIGPLPDASPVPDQVASALRNNALAICQEAPIRRAIMQAELAQQHHDGVAPMDPAGQPIAPEHPDLAAERLFDLFIQRYTMAWNENRLLPDVPNHDFLLDLTRGWAHDGHRIQFSIYWPGLDVAPVTVYGPGLGAPVLEPMDD